jgi:hypothetical protein
MLLIKNLFIEGPDCSGKTTVIDLLHKQTDYKFHAFDRSRISQYVFAKMYNRDVEMSRHMLEVEMSDLSNFYFVLIPTRELVLDRFTTRGDPIHKSEDAILKVLEAFQAVAEELEGRKNVAIVRFGIHGQDLLGDYSKASYHFFDYEDVSRELAQFCFSLCTFYENFITPEHLSEGVHSIVDVSENNELLNVRYSCYFDGLNCKIFHEKDMLEYDEEKEYYQKIEHKLLNKIKNELKGENEYNRVEGVESRRFIYTDDSCISMIHILCREHTHVKVYFRSSNVENTLQYDINFLHYLVEKIVPYLNPASKGVFMDVLFGSAHVLGEVEII